MSEKAEDVMEAVRIQLRELHGLLRFQRIQSERRGGALKGETFALRHLEKSLARYLGFYQGEDMEDVSARFVVKSIKRYEKKEVVFLVPIAPESMGYRGAIGGKVEDMDRIPDSVYGPWYDEMTPEFEVVDLHEDKGVRNPDRIGGRAGIRLEFRDRAPWPIGSVVELTAEAIGVEGDLTEPLRNAEREDEPAA